MATTTGLMGLGVPAEQALRTGIEIVPVTTSSTAQGAGTGVLTGKGNKLVLATAHAGDGAVTLPAQADLGDEVEIHNVSAANSADVYPAAGQTINQLTNVQGVAVAAGASLRCTKVSAINWRARPAAAVAAT
jgi:hypothetical protein